MTSNIDSARKPTRNEETHYVLVIHGTFNPPTQGELKWYQPDPSDPENFVERLNARLADTELGRAVWRGYRDGTVFAWSGENRHEARQQAAERLRDEIIDIANRDPTARIHLVAHSHGGNVVLKAIELYDLYLVAQGQALVSHLQATRVRSPDGGPRGSFYSWPYDYQSPTVQRVYSEVINQLDDDSQQNLLGLQRDILDEVISARDYHPHRPRRIWKKAAAVRERAAYLRWLRGEELDRPRVESMYWIFLRNWMRSPASNRIGKVVFLGTPFLVKRWRVPRTQWLNALQSASEYLWYLPFAVLQTYVGLMLLGSLLSLTPWVSGPAVNPLRWPWWLQLIGVLQAVSQYFFPQVEKRKRNTNVYFDFRGHRRDVALTIPRIPALVVTAKFLDEALLALSSDVVAHASLLPKLEEVFYAEAEQRLLKAYREAPKGARWRSLKKALRMSSRASTGQRVGEDPSIRAPIVYFRGARFIQRFVPKLLYTLALPVWVPFRYFLLVPIMRNMVVSITSSNAYGLPVLELRNARVYAESRLNLPAVFDEHHLDIAEMLLQGTRGKTATSPAVRPRADTVERRYAHLLDNAVLETKRRHSMASKGDNAWKRIVAAIPVLYDQYESTLPLENLPGPGDELAHLTEVIARSFGIPVGRLDRKDERESTLSREDFETRLAQIWFTLEERIKEVSGAVELNHSLYYSNPYVLEEIAKFLAHSEEPSAIDVATERIARGFRELEYLKKSPARWLEDKRSGACAPHTR